MLGFFPFQLFREKIEMQFYCLGTSTRTSRLRAALVAFHSALPHASDYKTNVNKLAKKQSHAARYY